MSQPGPVRVVFDCMVFLQAATRPGGPATRLFLDYVEGRTWPST